jgi:hypothetical protein
VRAELGPLLVRPLDVAERVLRRSRLDQRKLLGPVDVHAPIDLVPVFNLQLLGFLGRLSQHVRLRDGRAAASLCASAFDLAEPGAHGVVLAVKARNLDVDDLQVRYLLVSGNASHIVQVSILLADGLYATADTVG